MEAQARRFKKKDAPASRLHAEKERDRQAARDRLARDPHVLAQSVLVALILPLRCHEQLGRLRTRSGNGITCATQSRLPYRTAGQTGARLNHPLHPSGVTVPNCQDERGVQVVCVHLSYNGAHIQYNQIESSTQKQSVDSFRFHRGQTDRATPIAIGVRCQEQNRTGIAIVSR